MFPFRNANCEKFIKDFENGRLQTQPGCSAEETLEVLSFYVLVIMAEYYYLLTKAC